MSDPWQLRLLYDSECPLCSREVRLLERLDRGRGRVQFEDIAAASFDASRYRLEASAVMGRIHAVLPDGSVTEGMDVFRRAYAAVGLGWLLAPTGWPILRSIADAGYQVFARNRLRWTGRSVDCEGGRCEIDGPTGATLARGESLQ